MFQILFIILKKKKYASIAIIVFTIIAAISYYLTVASISNYSIKIYAEMSGVWFTIISLLLSLIIALFLATYFALLFFRRDIMKVKAAANKVAGGAGTVTGIAAAGCPTCGAPFLGLIGFPLGLASLPFRGLELKVLSIVFLLLSIFLISKNIKKNLVCQGAKYKVES